MQASGGAICSPTYLQALRTLYKSLFTHLLGVGKLQTVEQIYESKGPRREALPTQVWWLIVW